MKFTRHPSSDDSIKYFYFLSLFNLILILFLFIAFLPKLTMSPGLSVFLPRAISSEPVSREDFIVSILNDNTIYLDSRRVSWDELERFLRSQRSKAHQVLIKADQRSSVGVLVRVWDLFRKSGALKVNLATTE